MLWSLHAQSPLHRQLELCRWSELRLRASEGSWEPGTDMCQPRGSWKDPLTWWPHGPCQSPDFRPDLHGTPESAPDTRTQPAVRTAAAPRGARLRSRSEAQPELQAHSARGAACPLTQARPDSEPSLGQFPPRTPGSALPARSLAVAPTALCPHCCARRR